MLKFVVICSSASAELSVKCSSPSDDAPLRVQDLLCLPTIACTEASPRSRFNFRVSPGSGRKNFVEVSAQVEQVEVVGRRARVVGVL